MPQAYAPQRCVSVGDGVGEFSVERVEQAPYVNPFAVLLFAVLRKRAQRLLNGQTVNFRVSRYPSLRGVAQRGFWGV